MYAARYGHVDLVDLLLEMGHEEEVISVVCTKEDPVNNLANVD